MTLEEIKKAFDICCSGTQTGCTGCPIFKVEKQNGRKCKYNLFIRVIELITEREKEIEELRKKQDIKEFAEKVKMAFYYEFDEIIPSIMSNKIDKLLEEYDK